MITKKWEMEESCQRGSCPPLPVWIKDLGTDKNGVRWLCQVEYMYHWKPPVFQVLFDTDDSKYDDPFCRRSVIDSDNYWKAVEKRYNAKYVRYEDIEKVVDEFIKSKGLDPLK